MERIDGIGLGRYFLAFIFATIAFILIFLFVYSITYLNYLTINTKNLAVETYLEEIRESATTCEQELLHTSSELLDQVGSRLILLERRYGADHIRVLEQKQIYERLELTHYTIVNTYNEACGDDFTTVLFFYSNTEALQDASEQAGYVLNVFKNLHPETIMVYSFDYGLSVEGVDELKQRYSHARLPFSIINGEDIVYVDSIEDLNPYIP